MAPAHPAQKSRRRAAATIASRLTLEKVTRRFGRTTALSVSTSTSQPGEIVALLGHSGCGKTTLLQDRRRRRRPSPGRVLLDGREVAVPSVFVPPEKRSIGLMFQDYALFPHMTVLRNVMFGLTALRPRRRASEAARGARPRRPRALRGNLPARPLRRRAAAGGACARHRAAAGRAPDGRAVLRTRQPAKRQRAGRHALGAAREAGDGVIVTHDPEEAMRMADRIVLMRAAHRPGRAGAESSTPAGEPFRGAVLFRAERDWGRSSPARWTRSALPRLQPRRRRAAIVASACRAFATHRRRRNPGAGRGDHFLGEI